jgi:hypothetical protein
MLHAAIASPLTRVYVVMHNGVMLDYALDIVHKYILDNKLSYMVYAKPQGSKMVEFNGKRMYFITKSTIEIDSRLSGLSPESIFFDHSCDE